MSAATVDPHRMMVLDGQMLSDAREVATRQLWLLAARIGEVDTPDAVADALAGVVRVGHVAGLLDEPGWPAGDYPERTLDGDGRRVLAAAAREVADWYRGMADHVEAPGVDFCDAQTAAAERLLDALDATGGVS
jgi:hypothetical protein